MKIVRIKADGSADVIGMRCDRCGLYMRGTRSLREKFDVQEFLSVEFTAGYGGKAFLDGNRCRCELCQYCVRELIGPFLRKEPRERWLAR